MGLGIGLVMSPMSTAAMNTVDRTKSGAASGVVSMSRMVGGTVGLAVMGALVTTIGRSKLDSGLPHFPAAARAKLANALGAGAGLAGTPRRTWPAPSITLSCRRSGPGSESAPPSPSSARYSRSG